MQSIHTSNIYVYMYICILWFVGFVYSVAFSDDGAYLATGSGDSTVNLIDMKNLKLIKTFVDIHECNQNIVIIHMYIYIYIHIYME